MTNNINKILRSFNYQTNEEINQAKIKLSQLDPQLKKIWDDYLKTGIINNITIDQISLNTLIKEKKYTFPAALFALQWLIEDPKAAKEVLLKGYR